MTATRTLLDLSGPELITVYNRLTGSSLSRFASNSAGRSRIRGMLETWGKSEEEAVALLPTDEGYDPPASEINGELPETEKPTDKKTTSKAKPKAQAAKPATERRAYDHDGFAAKVFSLIAKNEPCKVGVVRTAIVKSDSEFAQLAPTQQRGRVRRAVRTLETNGRIKKDGSEFSTVTD